MIYNKWIDLDFRNLLSKVKCREFTELIKVVMTKIAVMVFMPFIFSEIETESI